jgi:hypothetical protein
LLLAPTIAALGWNRGGWIMNRANTLAIWCMFAQVFPLFQETFFNGKQFFPWAVLPTQYVNGIETVNAIYAASGLGEEVVTHTTVVAEGATAANPTAMLVISTLALITNIIALGYIIAQSKKRHINPYKEDVFVHQRYYMDSIARADMA